MFATAVATSNRSWSMQGREAMPWPVVVFFLAFGTFWIWMAYLMLVKPKQYVEWFLNKPYRWWGLQVSIVDERRFKRWSRIYAFFPCTAALIGLLVAVGVSLLQHR